MCARYSKKPSGYDTSAPLMVTNPHAAGIDIHLGIHWVAVPPRVASPPPPATLFPALARNCSGSRLILAGMRSVALAIIAT
jgi:hypothetical protein